MGRAAVRLAVGGGDRPLRLHQRAEAHRRSTTSPRSRTAPAASRTACRCCGPAGVNTGRLTKEEFVAVTSDQHRAHPQHLSAQGRGRCRLGRRSRGLGSEGDQDHLRQEPGEPHRLQRVRGLHLHRRAALTRCRAGGSPGRRATCAPRRATESSSRDALPRRPCRQRTWKEFSTPKPVSRAMSRVVP